MARPLRYPHKKLVGMDDALLDAIEAWRKQQSPIPSDAEAIRRLLAEALAAHGIKPE